MRATVVRDTAGSFLWDSLPVPPVPSPAHQQQDLQPILASFSDALSKLAKTRRPRRRPRDVMTESDGSEDAPRKFDYTSWAASYTSVAGNIRDIPVSWFPDFRRIEAIRVAGLDLAASGLPCVAASTFEAWTPRWSGEGLGATPLRRVGQHEGCGGSAGAQEAIHTFAKHFPVARRRR